MRIKLNLNGQRLAFLKQMGYIKFRLKYIKKRLKEVILMKPLQMTNQTNIIIINFRAK